MREEQIGKRGDTTRQQVIDAATGLFFARGYHATTMRAIAAEVGIKAGSIYNHFSAKEEILVEICRATTQALHDGALARLNGTVGPEARMRALVKWHTEFHARHQIEARVADEELRFISSGAREEVVRVRDAYTALVRAILADGRASGTWEVENDRVIGMAIMAMGTEVDVWYRKAGSLSPQQIGEITAEFALRGLRRR